MLIFSGYVVSSVNRILNGNFRKIFDELTGGEDSLTPEGLDPSLPQELEKEKARLVNTPRSQGMAQTGPDFNHGRITSAATLGEVHHLLQRSEAAAGPPPGEPSNGRLILQYLPFVEFPHTHESAKNN